MADHKETPSLVSSGSGMSGNGSFGSFHSEDMRSSGVGIGVASLSSSAAAAAARSPNARGTSHMFTPCASPQSIRVSHLSFAVDTSHVPVSQSLPYCIISIYHSFIHSFSK
jgi:hypothetical protein